MRKLICILSVVFVLVACSVPAFAIGEDYGAGRYSSMPFDYLVVSGFGGPIDYLGRFSRVGTSLSTTISGFSNGKSIYNYTTCATKSLFTTYEIPFIPATGATATTSVTLMAENTLLELNNNGTIVTVGLSKYNPDGSVPNWFMVKTIIVSGELYAFDEADGDADGFVTSKTLGFYHTFSDINVSNYEEINIADYVKQTLRLNSIPTPALQPERQLFKKLSIQFLIYNVYDSASFNFNINNTAYGTYTEPLNTLNWAVNSVNGFDLGKDTVTEYNNLDVLTFLRSTLDGFMNFEILPDFRLGSLLIAAVSFGVLLWFIRTVH